MTWPIRLRPRY